MYILALARSHKAGVPGVNQVGRIIVTSPWKCIRSAHSKHVSREPEAAPRFWIPFFEPQCSSFPDRVLLLGNACESGFN